jgi:hypothetical protein
MEEMGNSLDRELGRGLMKRSFECCARCCDKGFPGQEQMQQCIQQCQTPLQQVQQVQQQEVQNFQEKLQRCARACQDKIEDSMPADKSTINAMQQAQYQQNFDSCATKCITSHHAMLPKLKSSMAIQMKQAGTRIPSE